MKICIPIIVVLLFTLAACDLEDTNVNPNDPLDVPMQVLLPPALESSATEMAEDAAVISGIFSQYFKGVDNRTVPIEKYLLDESFDMNPLWSDFYTTSMSTLLIIMEKAEAENAPHYGGIAKTMMAMMLGTVSSIWGDIPYSDAFGGGAQPNAAFDPQDQIYATIQQLLDEAIADLDASESTFSPGTEDVIYGGNLSRWIKAANGLKARYWMHTIKRNPGAAMNALEAIASSFVSSNEEMVYEFGFTNAELNTWYAYFKNTPYIQVDDYFVDLLKGLEDPRERKLIKRSFGINRVGPYYASEFSPVPLLSFSEIKFLEAEALVRTNQTGAESALQAAIIAHVTQVTDGSISADSINAFAGRVGSLSGDEQTDLETIITQKYISHFTQIEGWTDFRRTGFPLLPINADGDNPQNPGGEIPRRFIYPQNERLFNSAFPSSNPNLQDRFWWDTP